ncbi:TPA: hypothetical protein ACH3X3_001482 [Trebouxia sp. C0006]
MTNDALLALLELHVLPPVAGLLTPRTSPFLATSPTLPTWLDGANSLTTGKATNGKVQRIVFAVENRHRWQTRARR